MSEASVKLELQEDIIQMNLGRITMFEFIKRLLESKSLENYFKTKGGSNNGNNL